jgi:hypothetical protein
MLFIARKKRWNWCTCFGNFLLFTFKPSQPSLLGWHVCMSTFVIRMKNLKIMWIYFMKYCLTSKIQKKRNLWTLIQSFVVKFLHGGFFFKMTQGHISLIRITEVINWSLGQGRKLLISWQQMIVVKSITPAMLNLTPVHI